MYITFNIYFPKTAVFFFHEEDEIAQKILENVVVDFLNLLIFSLSLQKSEIT